MSPRNKRNTRLTCALIAAAVLAIVLIAHLVLGGGKTNDPEEATKPNAVTVEVSPARVQPVDAVVVAQGTLAPSQGAGADIAPVNAGRLRDVRVREGDRVKAGQVVATLDSRLQSAQAESALSALKVSEMQAQQVELESRASSEDHASAVEVAGLDLEAAKTELDKLQSGARPQEIAQADQAVKQAQVTRDRAATELDRVEFLFSKGIDAKRQVDDAKAALGVADSALASAREQASLTRAGVREEDLRAARLRVQSARAALRQAKQGALQVDAKRRETQAAVESIRQKRADLMAAQTVVGYAELRSPISGTVTRRLLSAGDMADTTTPVLQIADTRALNLVASLPAADGSSVGTGMRARVTVQDASGRVFPGTTLSVGQVDPQSGMLSVRIAVPNPDGLLKTGAFATAEIVLRTDPDAVVVPKSAIITRNGKPVVFVVVGDTAHQASITTGVTQGDVVEILSGIQAGDRVISQGQYELSDGARVRVAR